MPTIVQTVSGKVTGLWGTAQVRSADGKMRPLKLGDIVRKGDVILTAQDGLVQLTPDADTAAAPATKAAEAGAEIDRVITQLNQNDPKAATAAGNLAYLRGAWCGSNVDKDPSARASFGLQRTQDHTVYRREHY